MKIIEPSYEIITQFNGSEILQFIERIGRTCYKSEDKITDDSWKRFITMILQRGHESILEHFSISVRFITNRGFTHEMVRHRIAAYSQESTRYCNYSKDKFSNEITCIRPSWFEKGLKQYKIWYTAMVHAEDFYFQLISLGTKPQEARGVLPIDLKTEIVTTANLREWRHIFKLRTSKAAHSSMRQLMLPLLAEFKEKIPVIFEDIR